MKFKCWPRVNSVGLSLFIFIIVSASIYIYTSFFYTNTTEESQLMSNDPFQNPNKKIPLLFYTSSNKKQAFYAASGLVHLGSNYFVIADDELELGIISEDESESQLLSLLPGKLPSDPKKRKKEKPDFEVLMYLADEASNWQGLVAIPSGSKDNRNRAVFIPLTSKYQLSGQSPIIFSMSPIFNELKRQFTDINIEGSFVKGEDWYLIHRGNSNNDTNRIFRFSKQVLINFILSDSSKNEFSSLKDNRYLKDFTELDIGYWDDVKLTLTDVTLFENRIYFLASAEDTDNPIDDGEIKGSIFGEVTIDNQIITKARFKSQKLEGLSIKKEDSENTFVSFVTDNDTHEEASFLYQYKIEKF